jgi:hypothetical protein
MRAAISSSDADSVTRRAAALAALLLLGAAAAIAIVLVVRDFPRGVAVLACAASAATVGWHGIVRRGRVRAPLLVVAALLLAGAVALIATGGRVLEGVFLIGCAALSVAAARSAFALHATLPRATPPQRAVLFWNPRSGGGKATRFGLEREARARGIEPVELTPGDDLETLVRDAVARGADALAMAGGDGSQAVVARVAAELDLPYACIPAGTRNHFALDLGVDRDDVVGALDAFVDGGERRVDLAEVNGRVFVNNVSLGVYADAVQRPGYREAKVRTILGTLPDTLGANGHHHLHWAGPDGAEETASPAILVSNNAYRLGRAIGSGTRSRIDRGVLGVAVFDAPGLVHRPWREWTTDMFEVGCDGPVNAGIDGEAAVLSPPLRFAIRPSVLRVRLARKHPGASPSAALPRTALASARALVGIALGRDGGPA